ncbi:chitinase [Metarhizium brunneum]
MWWGVYSANCTDTGLAPGSLKLDLNYRRNLVHFSTKHGAQQPDLVAASKDGVCDKTTGVTFNITEVKEVSWFNRHSVDHDVCPILAPEAPKPNPCLAKVNATTASSILYGIQSKACMRGLNPNVACSPEPQDQGAGTQTLAFSRGQISWLHQIEEYGNCRFGVEGDGKNGNIDFNIGGQDIIDIINDAIRMFGSSGRVGAKGNMDCKGTIKKQNVDWGLY